MPPSSSTVTGPAVSSRVSGTGSSVPNSLIDSRSMKFLSPAPMLEPVLQHSFGLRVDKDRAVHIKQQVDAFSGLAHIVRTELRNHLLPAQQEGAVESRARWLDQI